MARPAGRSTPELSGPRTADARELISGVLTGSPGGGWLPAEQAAGLLSYAPSLGGSRYRLAAGTCSCQTAARLRFRWLSVNLSALP